ncbi:MAG: hypothetical protein Q7R98_03030 [Candidatus Jorgensenbacteria bacterium]|nr:hypothetical protein [Candidatus Jorgensenbacteria bacterium]
MRIHVLGLCGLAVAYFCGEMTLLLATIYFKDVGPQSLFLWFLSATAFGIVGGTFLIEHYITKPFRRTG